MLACDETGDLPYFRPRSIASDDKGREYRVENQTDHEKWGSLGY